MKRMIPVIVALVVVWLLVRPEMCSPTRPYRGGITGSTYVLRYSDGYHPGAAELVSFQGPIVDLCVSDHEVYGGDVVCLVAVALFKVGGPGSLWACPCSQGASWLRNETPKATFDALYQMTCVVPEPKTK
jgi:hypothetical protein